VTRMTQGPRKLVFTRPAGRLALADAAFALVARMVSPLLRTYAAEPRFFPRTNAVWDRTGVLPMSFHYYSPVFRASDLSPAVWTDESALVGIDLQLSRQRELLRELADFSDEVANLDSGSGEADAFSPRNPAFGPGDADVLYSLLRTTRPGRVLEVGSGQSTRLVRRAIKANASDGYPCSHVAIEPYEAPWLERLGLDEVIRSPVQEVPIARFESLGPGDVLFIDSSHVIRTGGDVVHLFLEVLPRLRKGVLVHVHDVFLPRAYPRDWLEAQRRFWDEQYLLHAFLMFNSDFETVLALSYLWLHERELLLKACPWLRGSTSVPGSYWLRRRSGSEVIRSSATPS